MKENIAFITGRFSPAEAADVLMSLINEKIKFHTVKTLNLCGEESDINMASEERIGKLKEAKRRVEGLVLQAHREGMELSIESVIEIQLVKRLNSQC